MRVMVFEHVCGGGMNNEPLPSAYVAQGGAMLAALVADFVNAGHHVVTTRDARLAPALAACEVHVVNPNDCINDVFDSLVRQADAVAVIAPECGGVLVDWLRRVQTIGTRNLGCNVQSAALCSDKLALADALTRHCVPTPPTNAGHLLLQGGAAIVKPRFGAGCEDTHFVDQWSDTVGSSEMITQPYVPGLAVSVSFIIGPRGIRPLLAGEQHIKCDNHVLHYRGGSLPLDDALARRAIPLARRAVESIPGLNGFVGVDLILADHGPDHDSVIEINPRLTLSYVGLRELCSTNLAAAMLDSTAPVKWRRGRVRFDADGAMQRELEHA